MNDGTEAQELQELNEFDIQRLNTSLKLAKGNATDGYRQLGEVLDLLKEARDLLEAVKNHELQDQAQDLINRIDVFYPRA